jgi:hypothetical protein
VCVFLREPQESLRECSEVEEEALRDAAPTLFPDPCLFLPQFYIVRSGDSTGVTGPWGRAVHGVRLVLGAAPDAQFDGPSQRGAPNCGAVGAGKYSSCGPRVWLPTRARRAGHALR